MRGRCPGPLDERDAAGAGLLGQPAAEFKPARRRRSLSARASAIRHARRSGVQQHHPVRPAALQLHGQPVAASRRCRRCACPRLLQQRARARRSRPRAGSDSRLTIVRTAPWSRRRSTPPSRSSRRSSTPHACRQPSASPRRPIRVSDAPCPTETRPVAADSVSSPDADAAGERVDRFLADAIGTLSRSRVKSLIEAGHVSRDGMPLSEPAEPVRAGAATRSTCPRRRRPARTQAIPFADPLRGRRPDRARQAGRAGGASRARQRGRHAGQRAARPLRRQPARHRRRAAARHRPPAGQGHVRRHGRGQDRAGACRRCPPPSPRATSTAPISRSCWGAARARRRRDRRRRSAATRATASAWRWSRRAARPALTRYRTLRAWRGRGALLECRLATGRTHQIRVHLASAATRWSATRSISRRIPAAARALPEPAAARFARLSRARRCTPPGWASRIRAPASRLPSQRRRRPTCGAARSAGCAGLTPLAASLTRVEVRILDRTDPVLY